MKFIFPSLAPLLLIFSVEARGQPPAKTKHLFVITIDGFRWQEVFSGADPSLVVNEEYVRDTALMRSLYWDSTAELRRRKLLPFFWGTIAEKGRLYCNPLWGNKIKIKKYDKISHPAYNERFPR